VTRGRTGAGLVSTVVAVSVLAAAVLTLLPAPTWRAGSTSPGQSAGGSGSRCRRPHGRRRQRRTEPAKAGSPAGASRVGGFLGFRHAPRHGGCAVRSVTPSSMRVRAQRPPTGMARPSTPGTAKSWQSPTKNVPVALYRVRPSRCRRPPTHRWSTIPASAGSGPADLYMAQSSPNLIFHADSAARCGSRLATSYISGNDTIVSPIALGPRCHLHRAVRCEHGHPRAAAGGYRDAGGDASEDAPVRSATAHAYPASKPWPRRSRPRRRRPTPRSRPHRLDGRPYALLDRHPPSRPEPTPSTSSSSATAPDSASRSPRHGRHAAVDRHPRPRSRRLRSGSYNPITDLYESGQGRTRVGWQCGRPLGCRAVDPTAVVRLANPSPGATPSPRRRGAPLRQLRSSPSVVVLAAPPSPALVIRWRAAAGTWAIAVAAPHGARRSASRETEETGRDDHRYASALDDTAGGRVGPGGRWPWLIAGQRHGEHEPLGQRRRHAEHVSSHHPPRSTPRRGPGAPVGPDPQPACTAGWRRLPQAGGCPRASSRLARAFQQRTEAHQLAGPAETRGQRSTFPCRRRGRRSGVPRQTRRPR